MNHLFALFGHDRGPAEPHRVLPVAELREWPYLWTTDPRLAPLVGAARGQLRYFGATDPAYPTVPLWSTGAAEPADNGIRDKFWQRLVVETAGHLPQPGFAAVTGSRIEAGHTPWSVRVDAIDFRPVHAQLLAAVPGVVAVAEGGFVAAARDGRVQVTARNPHVAAHLGAAEVVLSRERWARFADALCAELLPLGDTLSAFNPAAELGDALTSVPGSYILKPRFGSNGVGVVRVVSAPDGTLAVESDCPDTALYLDDFPRDAGLRGRDLVAAVAAHRARFVDRARAGIPERLFGHSILEEEIPPHRADGSLYEPRVVVQRVGESFAVLGAICKRIDTPIGAVVARDFREEPLEESLGRFLSERAPGNVAYRVERARAELFAACDQLRAAVVPLLELRGARVHQFGIDCRMCWNAPAGRVEFPFLEFQFGIGRIDGPLAGYKTRAELAREFGPEVG